MAARCSCVPTSLLEHSQGARDALNQIVTFSHFNLELVLMVCGIRTGLINSVCIGFSSVELRSYHILLAGLSERGKKQSNFENRPVLFNSLPLPTQLCPKLRIPVLMQLKEVPQLHGSLLLGSIQMVFIQIPNPFDDM